MNWNETITYEQPINEHIRLCLRLEHLFAQIDHFIKDSSDWHGRATVDAILEISSLIDRPDIKSMFNKEIHRYYITLINLQTKPHIDQQKLEHVLEEIKSLKHTLQYSGSKLGHSLRTNEFLSNIRMYRHNPGGICIFDAPAYHYWLQQPYEQRAPQLNAWLDALTPVRQLTQLILRLIRESNVPEFKTADKGQYQLNLNPKSPYQLLRLALPKEVKLYPEVSAGRHRLCIRFFSPNYNGKPQIYYDEVLFKLTCCVF